MVQKEWRFQSTRPLRGETVRHFTAAQIFAFSIHSPLAGRDLVIAFSSAHALFFQSTRPLRGETKTDVLFGVIFDFSIHSPLAGRDRQAVNRSDWL